MIHTRARTSYPLFGLFVAVSMVLIIVLLIATSITQPPEQQAQKWAESLGLKVEHVACQLFDSDGDLYRSCAIKTSTGVEYVECDIFGKGCRAPKAVIRHYQ